MCKTAFKLQKFDFCVSHEVIYYPSLQLFNYLLRFYLFVLKIWNNQEMALSTVGVVSF